MNTLAHQRQLLARWILRISISLSLLFIVTGLVIFFLHGASRVPAAPSGRLSSILETVMHSGIGLHASAFLVAGIVVLLLTPIARLLSGVVASARARDWLYVAIGLIVLVLVLVGLYAGQVTA
ncbi:MAG: DUF1634 domain-containing protein [Gammaproteobacteria bacterium]